MGIITAMDLNGFITLFSGVALLAAKPGPGMMTVATKAMGEGLKSALAFMLGTVLAKVVLFTLVAMGFTLILDKVTFLIVVFKTVAGAYLIWLGVKGFTRQFPDPEANAEAVRKKGILENILGGFLLTISNPFDIVFFTGVLPSVITVGYTTTMQYALCIVTIASAYAMIALSYAVPIAVSRRFFIRPVLRKMNIVASTGLILVGIYIGLSALWATGLPDVF